MAKSQQAAPPRADAKLKQLAVFEGNWALEGKQLETRIGAAAEIHGSERYEWLKGGQFLIHYFDTKLGENDATCIEIIGYDASTKSFPMHTFYNNGVTAEWTLEERDGDWVITGGWEMKGERFQVRCLIDFTGDGNTRKARWQASSDGQQWEMFWDITATRTTDI